MFPIWVSGRESDSDCACSRSFLSYYFLHEISTVWKMPETGTSVVLSVACFDVSFVAFITYSFFVCSIMVSEWTHFGKELFTRIKLPVLSLCDLFILVMCLYFPLWIRGQVFRF